MAYFIVRQSRGAPATSPGVVGTVIADNQAFETYAEAEAEARVRYPAEPAVIVAAENPREAIARVLGRT